MRGLLEAVRLLALVTMYVVTYFMRRLVFWFEFDLFLLVLMLMYAVILYGIGGKLLYAALAVGFFVKLVLEVDLTQYMIPIWYIFVCAVSLDYCVSLFMKRRE